MKRFASTLCLCLMLAGCGGSNEELRAWMNDQKALVHPNIPKVTEPKIYMPFIYSQRDQIDPFDPAKVTNALKKLAAKSDNGLAPDQNRRKEALEAFPLDTITMVGTILQPNRPKVALLKVDNIVYQARLGNYVGQNFGVVTEIAEDHVTLKEVVQDASGEWTERVSTLQLQETKK